MKLLALGAFAIAFHLVAFKFSGPPRVQVIVDELITDNGPGWTVRNDYIESHPDLPPEVRYAIAVDGITLGMSREEIYLVCGPPDDISTEKSSRVATRTGIVEFLAYYTDFNGEAYIIGLNSTDKATSIYFPEHHNEPLEIALADIK